MRDSKKPLPKKAAKAPAGTGRQGPVRKPSKGRPQIGRSQASLRTQSRRFRAFV